MSCCAQLRWVKKIPVFSAAFFFFLSLSNGFSQTNQTVYSDSLQNGWQNWSWATVNLANSSPVEAGTRSISISSTNWQALYFHHTAQDASTFGSISFWVNGGPSGGQHIRVQGTRNQVAQTNMVELAALPANAWRQDAVQLSALGVAGVADFDGFWLQVEDPALAPTFYADEISLQTNGVTVTVTNTTFTIAIDASSGRHPISPL